VVVTEDTADPVNTRSVVVKKYDVAGREIFSSYPTTSAATATYGTHTFYDGLGRVVRVEQDSELEQGRLITATEYLTGGRIKVTNPRGKATTTTYQQFGSPDTSNPTLVALPEGPYVGIVRDIFGKPLTITRAGPFGGTTLSATRRYVYDAYQRLCKIVSPESGAEITDYDAAGNIRWTASGSTLTTATCNRVDVSELAKVYRTYDSLGRLWTVDTPDGNGEQTHVYEADGLVKSILTTNADGGDVTNSYTYNSRRLLATETISQAGADTWTFAHEYDANAHETRLLYPNGLAVTYVPDALGRPKQVGSFATAISYFPSGAIKRFTYGNGIVHTLTQNARGIPSRSLDIGNGNAIIDDRYTYDANGNVLTIIGDAPAHPMDRGMSYDGLDRLTNTVSSAMWGVASYTYDPLDNLRTASLDLAVDTYGYDNAKNRLATVAHSQSGIDTYATDARGNITSDGNQVYTFDWLNRMTSVVGKATYRYDGLGRRVLSARTANRIKYAYAQDGRQLYAQDNTRRTSNVYLGNTLVAEVFQGLAGGAFTTQYTHTDALGSPIAKTDSAGVEVPGTHESYSPFGRPMEVDADGVGYAGHIRDADTHLTYMQQRYYDPRIGRFLSVDPVQADTEDGGNFNRYWYANNNPYRLVDPDGRFAQNADPFANAGPNLGSCRFCVDAKKKPKSIAQKAARNAGWFFSSLKVDAKVSAGLNLKLKVGPARVQGGVGSLTFIGGQLSSRHWTAYTEVQGWSAGGQYGDFVAGRIGGTHRENFFDSRNRGNWTDEKTEAQVGFGFKNTGATVQDVSIEANVLVATVAVSVDPGRILYSFMQWDDDAADPDD
jgi:RHS repeat-associated protein